MFQFFLAGQSIAVNNAHPILTIMFKNILRTFEAEILKIFKNIQPQWKTRRSYKMSAVPEPLIVPQDLSSFIV